MEGITILDTEVVREVVGYKFGFSIVGLFILILAAFIIALLISVLKYDGFKHNKLFCIISSLMIILFLYLGISLFTHKNINIVEHNEYDVIIDSEILDYDKFNSTYEIVRQINTNEFIIKEN